MLPCPCAAKPFNDAIALKSTVNDVAVTEGTAVGEWAPAPDGVVLLLHATSAIAMIDAAATNEATRELLILLLSLRGRIRRFL